MQVSQETKRRKDMRKEAYQRKTAPSTPSARRTNREREYGAACPEAQGEKPAETNRDCPNSSPDFSMQARISSRRARGVTPSRTSRQEWRICSRMNASGRSPVVQMPVQCFLLKRQAGSASAYLSRKAIAAPGSHSTAMQPNSALSAQAYMRPPILQTSVVSSNGGASPLSGSERQ